MTQETAQAESSGTGRASWKGVLRYGAVGAFNTLFGYACYAAFVALYKRVLPEKYMGVSVDLASITSTPIGVVMSYFTYKLLVFKTKGNYLREFLRCLAVYSLAMLPGLVVLPVLTHALLRIPTLHNAAPFLAGAIVMGSTAVMTYLAHRKYSFSTSRSLLPRMFAKV